MEEILTGQFRVTGVDVDGKIYEKVSRANLSAPNHNLTLDYHSILLSLNTNDILDLIIYKGDIKNELIPKEYEYAMCGMCYQQEEKKTFVSFGGLLLIVEGEIDLTDSDEVGLAIKKI